VETTLTVTEDIETNVAEELDEVLAADAGQLVTEVDHPMPEDERETYEERLESVPRAHAAAAARVHKLFAG
jgi:hypothetical protein